MLSETVIKKWMEEQYISPSGCYLVGVSGGVDSVVLLDLLSRAGLNLIVAHFDHRIRNASVQDADFVRELAGGYHYPFCHGVGNEVLFSNQDGKGLEEEARKQRYRFLFHEARIHQCDGVMVAHHADDQVETVLMHFIRGAGTDGLSGMRYQTILPEWDPNIPLLRPLLGVWRQDIEEYCRENHLQYVVDETNTDPFYFRNQLRLNLIPTLSDCNPEFKKHVWQTAQLLSGDRLIVQEVMMNDWQACVVAESTDSVITLDYQQAMILPEARQRNLLRELLHRMNPEQRDIGFQTVQEVQTFLKAPYERKTYTWQENHILQIHDTVVLCGMKQNVIQKLIQPYPQWVMEPERIPINMDGDMCLNRGTHIIWEQLTPAELPSEYDQVMDHLEVWIDADALGETINFRHFLPGDRMKPLGMADKTSKVSDLMVNAKVIRYARKQYLILEAGQGIFWIPGLCMADFCKITPDTRRILHFRCEMQNRPSSDI